MRHQTDKPLRLLRSLAAPENGLRGKKVGIENGVKIVVFFFLVISIYSAQLGQADGGIAR